MVPEAVTGPPACLAPPLAKLDRAIEKADRHLVNLAKAQTPEHRAEIIAAAECHGTTVDAMLEDLRREEDRVRGVRAALVKVRNNRARRENRHDAGRERRRPLPE